MSITSFMTERHPSKPHSTSEHTGIEESEATKNQIGGNPSIWRQIQLCDTVRAETSVAQSNCLISPHLNPVIVYQKIGFMSNHFRMSICYFLGIVVVLRRHEQQIVFEKFNLMSNNTVATHDSRTIRRARKPCLLLSLEHDANWVGQTFG